MKFDTICFLAYLFIGVILVESCPIEFQNRCLCGTVSYLGKQRFVVNCTNSEFEDALMLENLPPQTEALIFTGNLLIIKYFVF